MKRLPRTVSRRAALGVFLALQGAVLAGAPLVDALLEAAAPATVTHVESEDAPPCPPGHSELFCPLCQVVKLQALPIPASSDQVAQPADAAERTAVGAAPEARPAPSALHARAPPSV